MTAPALPLLVAVTGAPGTGKTTLSGVLARRLGFVPLSRDRFKETLWDAWHGQPELQRQVPVAHFGAYYASLRAVLETGLSVVAEGSVHQTRGASELSALQPLARLVIVHCVAPREVYLERFEQRATPDRHPAHQDARIVQDIRTTPERWAHFEQPAELEVPVLTVNTVDGYSLPLDEIVAFVLSASPSRP